MIESAISWALGNMFYLIIGAFFVYMIIQVFRGSYGRGGSSDDNTMIDGGHHHHNWSSVHHNSSDGGGSGD